MGYGLVALRRTSLAMLVSGCVVLAGCGASQTLSSQQQQQLASWVQALQTNAAHTASRRAELDRQAPMRAAARHQYIKWQGEHTGVFAVDAGATTAAVDAYMHRLARVSRSLVIFNKRGVPVNIDNAALAAMIRPLNRDPSLLRYRAQATDTVARMRSLLDGKRDDATVTAASLHRRYTVSGLLGQTSARISAQYPDLAHRLAQIRGQLKH
jgi:outer membrane murein-binding lipoprotein Lpp